MAKPVMESANIIANDWADWCGENTPWVKALREFASFGGLVTWWCGYPQSKSAIPLTFSLHRLDGTKLPCAYRLKDIRAAVAILRAEQEATT